MKRKLTMLLFSIIIILCISLIGGIYFRFFQTKYVKGTLNFSIETKEVSASVKANYISNNSNYIFWSDFRDGKNNQKVYGYNLKKEQEFLVSTKYSENIAYVKCNNNYVVWREKRNNITVLCGYNILTKEEFFITDKSHGAHNLILTENNLFWQEMKTINNIVDVDIMEYNFDTKNIIIIANTNKTEWILGCNDEFIAWVYLSDDNINVKNVCYKNLSNGNLHNISLDTASCVYEKLSGNIYSNYLFFIEKEPNDIYCSMKIYNMLDNNLVKTINLETIPIKDFKIGFINSKISILLISTNPWNNEGYKIYIINPKIDINEEPIITPINTNLVSSNEVIYPSPNAPLDNLNHIFIPYGSSFRGFGDTSKNIFGYMNLSFYDINSGEFYKIIEDNTLFKFDNPIESDNKIIVVLALRLNKNSTPPYFIKYVEIKLN